MCRNYYPVEMMTDRHTNQKGYTRPNNNKINPMFFGVCQYLSQNRLRSPMPEGGEP
jgi:hypothetical protein